MIWATDSEGRIEYVNSAYFRISSDGVLLYANAPARAWLAELSWQDGAPIPAPVRSVAEKFTTENRVVEIVEEIKNPTGKTFLISAVKPAGEGYINLYCRDITDKKRAEEELIRLNQSLEQQVAERTELAESRAKQLARLTSELTLAEERERKRLSEILHEDLQQLLVGIKLNLDALNGYVKEDRSPALNTARKLLTESIQTSRSITSELSPPILYQNGLTAGLEWLSRWKQEKYGFRVELQVEAESVTLPEDKTIVLFRSVSELLLNAIKHSGADSAKVLLSKDRPDRLRIAVSDSGRGFDSLRIWKREQESGFGLFAIRERLEMMGGCFEIESSPGNGASLSLVIPLETKTCVDEDEKQIRKIIAKVHQAKRSGDKIRVLLVDDHTVVRQGLSTMLNLHADVAVVGEAADGNEAVEKARKLQPDVILMDISVPKLDGIEATRIIHAELPHTRIIGLSMHDKQDQADRLIEAGASAYCTKDGDTGVLLSAIRG